VARRPHTGPDGIAVVDKEAGWTSHDVVAKARGLLGTRKVGHSGTLDPDATGVLVLGVGAGTRLLRFLEAETKQYDGVIAFGVETATLDASGEITATHDMSGLDPAAVRAAAAGFVGPIMQIPPMVSAIKIDGRRLHQLAREGIEVERPPRPVIIHSFEVSPTADPLRWRASVRCSAGTYIRTLAADLGSVLDGGAHLASLRRTAVGRFGLDTAMPLEQISVQPLVSAIPEGRRLDVDESVIAAIRTGRVFESEDLPAVGDGPWWAVDGEQVIAVLERHPDGRRIKPSVVLAMPTAG